MRLCIMGSLLSEPRINTSTPSLLRRLHCPVLENEWENTVMPAKYRQGDDLLHMLVRAYKSNLCRGELGDFETQKPLTLAFGWKLSNFDSFF